jgi:hypothetical protein
MLQHWQGTVGPAGEKRAAMATEVDSVSQSSVRLPAEGSDLRISAEEKQEPRSQSSCRLAGTVAWNAPLEHRADPEL